MKNTQNYRRFLIATARQHLIKARIARQCITVTSGFHEQQWERNMHYARQAIRMAGVL